jgi:hypothetical protein
LKLPTRAYARPRPRSRKGMSYLNLVALPTERRRSSWWGRVIFYAADVDALYEGALAAGCQLTTAPHDADGRAFLPPD